MNEEISIKWAKKFNWYGSQYIQLHWNQKKSANRKKNENVMPRDVTHRQAVHNHFTCWNHNFSGPIVIIQWVGRLFTAVSEWFTIAKLTC